MKPEDLDLFANIVKQRTGAVLSADKSYLLESRLPPVARKCNFKTIDELAQAVRTKRDESTMNEIAEAMISSDTSFFRDRRPFDQFRKTLLPRLLQARAAKKHLRLWSAGCSSGQEAYSLAMISAEEAAALQGWKVDIVATDMSNEMIARAENGTYSQFEAQRGLPITLLIKYFTQRSDKWQIKEEIREKVQFRVGNLMHDLGPVGVFDVIFCRNIIVNFDPPTKARVLGALASVLAPDGVLILGAAESVFGATEKFKPMENERCLFVLNAPGSIARAVG